jgi:hypothetical protein
MRRSSSSIRKFLRDDSRKFVLAVAAWLNGDPWDQEGYDLPQGTVFPYPELDEVLDEVRGWVRQLLSSNWRLERWREINWKEWKHIERTLSVFKPVPILDDSNKLRLYFERTDSPLPLDAHVWVFIELLRNPEREQLGLCDRCDKFYASMGRYRRKKFCSKRCARNATVTRYMGRRRHELRQVKINLSKRLLRRFGNRHGDWKRWLFLKTKGTKNQLTPTFLTRAVSKGDLANPLTEPGGGKLRGTLKPGPRPEAKKT